VITEAEQNNEGFESTLETFADEKVLYKECRKEREKCC